MGSTTHTETTNGIVIRETAACDDDVARELAAALDEETAAAVDRICADVRHVATLWLEDEPAFDTGVSLTLPPTFEIVDVWVAATGSVALTVDTTLDDTEGDA